MHLIPVRTAGLVGDWWPGAGQDFAIVYAHGLGGDRRGQKATALATACGQRGWPYAAFDFFAHGDSAGQMRDLTGSRILADLANIRDFLATHGVRWLLLVGSSMGGWASAWFAKQHADAVLACALIAPALRFPEARWLALSEAERNDWQTSGVRRVQNDFIDVELSYGLVAERDRYPFAELVREWNTPTLIYHGWADTIVLPAQSLEFLDRVPPGMVELRLWKTGDHRLSGTQAEIAAAVLEFFAVEGEVG
jgi:pimeloyl-ACP methyl ester carboxylesterase